MRLQREEQCTFTGCGNTFIGPAQQKYCNNPKCIAARKLVAQQTRKEKVDDDANNLTITKGKFPYGTLLNIQCTATGPAGRCTHRFTVVYDPQRIVYPKYCDSHRNAYQRARFEGKT